MNNTKRKFLAGVIAAVVCFTMVLTSFGALIGAAFGILSNEDLINAINNGSLYLGDGVNLSNITLSGGNITDVAKDGYHAVSSNEVEEKTNDYTKYNAPYYAEKYADGTHTIKYADNTTKSFTVDYAAESTAVAPGTGDRLNTVSTNKIYYLANGMRSNAAEGGNISTIKVTNAHLVIALATAEDIIAKVAPSQLNGDHYKNAFSPDHIEDVDKFEFKKGIIKITNAEGEDEYVEADIGASEAVYGVCFKMTYLSVIKDASLTIVGRDFNENGYIDDLPVQVTVNNANYWIYEKVTLSGSSTYRQFAINEKLFASRASMIDKYEGQAMPLISIYGGSTAAKAQKIIISGADLRNNFNKKKNNISDNSSTRDWVDDDANLGGGAIYLAAGSANQVNRTTTTCGYFSDVIITSSTFSYCGAARGGAIMVGKNFDANCLDFSYSNFSYCYTVYDCYGRHDAASFNRITQSGDGGAICFYQDDTFTDPWSLYHNNPSLIVINEVDLTGADFKYCYAMRDGGAIFFGGYNYGEDVRTRIHATSGNSKDSFRYRNGSSTTVYTANDELGTRIKKLTIKDASFYGCGAGWMIDKAPVDANGNPLTGSSFIYTTTPGNLSDTIFAALEEELRLIDIVGGYSTTKNSALFSVVFDTSNVTTQADIRWMQSYDGGVGSPDDTKYIDDMITTDYKLYNDAANHPNSVRRHWNGWLNILQGYVKADYRRGGAMALNCRIAEMVVSDTTFKYCATDSEGSAVYMDDFFVSPHVEFNNCLFENNLGTMSGTGTGTGTLRSTGLVAADVHVNNCSFLYNCNMNSGAVCMNLNNTYTGAEVGGVSYKVSYAEAGAQPDGWGYAGTEINNCVFFGNFAQAEGAAVKSSGVTDISSSTFAYNVTNNGEGGAIHFSSYDRIGVDVHSKTAHMRLDPKVGDGHTIICNNRVGGTAANDGGGAIAIVASNSRSIGDTSLSTDSATVSGKSISSRKFTFKFELGGLLIFNNYSAVSGGGILFRIDSTNPSTLDAKYKTFAWLYDKIITLNEGYIFNNVAKNSGGGVAIFDEYSQLKAVAQSSIAGANIYNNSADSTGGGLYLCVKNGDINITGGHVLANVANGAGGGGIMIENTTSVNINGGKIGVTQYKHPVVTLGYDKATKTGIHTFEVPSGAEFTDGGNKAARAYANGVVPGLGGGIYVNNTIKLSDDTFVDHHTAIIMTAGMIEGNIAAGNGGGLYMARPTGNDTYGKITFNMSGSGTSYGFVGNKAINGGGIYVSSGDVTSDDYRYTVALGGGTINENTASTNGGGVYVAKGADFTMDGGNIVSNTATSGNGGGVYVEGAGSDTTTTYKVPKDAIKSDGTLDQSKLTLNVGIIQNAGWTEKEQADLVISHVETYFYETLDFSRSYVKLNLIPFVYSENGGSIKTTVTNMVKYFKDNSHGDLHAVLGGGANIYEQAHATTHKFDIWPNTGNTGTASNATDYLLKSQYYSGTSKRNVAPMTIGCTATNMAGYVAALNDLTELFYRYVVQEASTYEMNTLEEAQTAGFIGEYKVTTKTDPSTVTLTAGNIAGNSALNGFGGGICCDAAVVNMNATSTTAYPVIDGNSAKNGGGVAAYAGGDITMQGGYVINNKAIAVGTPDKTTAQVQHEGNNGVGGGIYISNSWDGGKTPTNKSTFTINTEGGVHTGIYLNSASFAADDVYASGHGTKLDVPAFKSMYIKDNAGKVTGWFEDYATQDSKYSTGLRGYEAATVANVERYDDASAAGHDTYEAWITADDKTTNGANNKISKPNKYINNENTYVCVTLGAYVVYDGNLTITKKIANAASFDPEQAFIFHVRQTFDQYGVATGKDAIDIYVTINVTDSTKLENSVTISGLPLGVYEVTEMTEWSWRYEVQSTSVEATNGSATDTSATLNDAIVEVALEPANTQEGTCNDPKITFVNKIEHNEWLDGNSPKVVNTAGNAKAAIVGQTASISDTYANFKREETLI